MSKIDNVTEYIVDVIGVVAITFILLWLLRIVLEKIFKHTELIEEKKKATVITVLKNTTNYAVFTVFIIVALKPFVDLSNLLVAGGVIGIVIGFGAQSLIKDFLYGFFFLFEGQLKQGDYVTLNDSGESGTVEELGFRTLKIRLNNGKLMTISNGEIKKVINANIEKRRVFESVTFSFREDPKKIKEELEKFCEEMNNEYEGVFYQDEEHNDVEQFNVFGLSTIGDNDSGWVYKVAATLKEEEYLKTAQEMKQRLAEMIYEKNLKVAEKQLFYQTRANVKK